MKESSFVNAKGPVKYSPPSVQPKGMDSKKMMAQVLSVARKPHDMMDTISSNESREPLDAMKAS